MTAANRGRAAATPLSGGRVWRWGILCLAVCLAGVAWWHWESGKRPAARRPLPEVSRTNLVRRDDRWFQASATNPFTGWLLDFYLDGSRQSRSLISNGLPNGPSEGWYTNGQIQIVEGFKDGISHGSRTKWHPNGARMTEGRIVDGKHEGVFRRWYDNGGLAEEIEMRNGQADGPSRAYYPSGFLKSEVTLRQGEVVERVAWVDGEKRP